MSKIALLLSPGFADWEYAFIAGTGRLYYGLDVRFFATNPGNLTSQGGLECIAPHGKDDLVSWQPDVLVVVGGLVWEQDTAPDIKPLLINQLDSDGAVAGICGGTLALARAGILDDVEHTSNSAEFLETARGYAGHNTYRNSRSAIVSDRIVTSPGPAPISFTAEVFRLAGLDRKTVDSFQTMMAAEHLNTA
ncbi:MAG: DJ-1/PfpI family protein [Pseudomonadota bacterium]